MAAGCVQPSYKPASNAALARVLHRLGIQITTVDNERCCGAVSFHLDAIDEAKQLMRANIDAWWPAIEEGAEAVISTASGCGVMIKDYGHALKEDKDYAEKARKVSELAKDPCEILESEELNALSIPNKPRVAFQSPCTLQHGQKLAGRVENILRKLGFELVPVEESHFCCGSAGTYSVLQKELSTQLQQRKIGHLEKASPEVIATANIGCHLHLETETSIPVKHWLELIDDPSLPL